MASTPNQNDAPTNAKKAPPPEPRSTWGGIPKELWDSAISSELKRLGLQRSTKRCGAITGDRPLADASKYYCHYNNFVHFAYSVGDYSSLLMFDDYCPQYCVPPDVHTLVGYVNSRFGQPGDDVVDSSGTKPFLDCKGKHVRCLGGWNDPSRLDHFRAAINAMVTARQQSHSYGEACADCVKLYDEVDECRGCRFHKGRPLLMRNGNPCLSLVYKNNSKRIKSKSTWKVEGAGQLLPGDMRAVLKALLYQNTIEKLQIAVILLVSVALFLRKDEFMHMTVEHFQKDLSIVQDKSRAPEALNVMVKGKTDTHYVNFYLWLNNETPDLCPVRYLLVYLYLAGIKSGPLFPTEAELYNPPPDGNYKSTVSEDKIYEQLDTLWSKVLKRFSKLGTHTCRKTAYLWACLGLEGGMASLPVIMQAARHKTFATAQTYLQNAYSLAHGIGLRSNSKHKVGKWRTPWVGDMLANHRDLCIDDRACQADLY